MIHADGRYLLSRRRVDHEQSRMPTNTLRFSNFDHRKNSSHFQAELLTFRHLAIACGYSAFDERECRVPFSAASDRFSIPKALAYSTKRAETSVSNPSRTALTRASVSVTAADRIFSSPLRSSAGEIGLIEASSSRPSRAATAIATSCRRTAEPSSLEADSRRLCRRSIFPRRAANSFSASSFLVKASAIAALDAETRSCNSALIASPSSEFVIDSPQTEHECVALSSSFFALEIA